MAQVRAGTGGFVSTVHSDKLCATAVPEKRRKNVLRDDCASWRVLAIDTTYDAANLGGMIRSASAFGVDALLLSDDSCDAWYRRSVRVSMGHIFRVPVVRCPDLAGTLRELQDSGLRYARLDFHVVAELVVSAVVLRPSTGTNFCSCAGATLQ